MDAWTEGGLERRRTSGIALRGLALAAVLIWGAGELRAQDTEDPDTDPEACACVGLERADLEEIRERVRRQVRRSIEEVDDLRDALRSRAHLGVEIRADQAEDVDARGVRILGVRPEGPADEAGIEEGDLIIEVDGQVLVEPLPDPEREEDVDADRSAPVQRLMLLLSEREPGDTMAVTYERDGERQTTGVELASPPEIGRFRRPGPPPHAPRIRRFRGPDRPPGSGIPGAALRRRSADRFDLRVHTLEPELGSYFGTDAGALVLDVGEDSPLGLRPGDVVLAVGDRTVEDAADFRRILGSYEEGEEVRLRILRDGSERAVTGNAP